MDAKQIDLSGYLYQNWGLDNTNPPVVLNPDASLHACIAWCWGEVAEAHGLAMVARVNNIEGGAVLDAVLSRLTALERMLEHLGERTRADKAGRA
ncbi:MAG: hypothetical protein JSS17_17830 [Proteobacteria bacterium]|nr:hypothetical protein [Pseudomonadota bacterium]